tara:strand:+ start:252 stop:533 length:282 start_codon:yes stop_codon:yes gene_type:complete
LVVFHFKKKLVCGKKCHENFEANIMKLIPAFKSGINGHCTLSHNINKHEVWLALYTDGKHENWTMDGIKKTKFNTIQEKFKGDLPTQSELENL